MGDSVKKETPLWDIARASVVERTGEGRYRWEIPDGWQQGRGAFGGLVIGAMVRALEDTAGDPSRPLRSLTADLCAPALPGPAEIHVATLRRGKGMTYLDARLVQRGEVIARTSAAFAAGRAVRTPLVTVAEHGLPPWKEVAVVPIGPPFGPVFSQWFEFRPVPPLPFTGSITPVANGWVRERTPPARLDTTAVVALMDAWWPAFFSLETAPRPAATVTFTLELLTDPATVPAGDPLAFTSHVAAARDGFTVEFRELWSGGQRVALNQQTFALLG